MGHYWRQNCAVNPRQEFQNLDRHWQTGASESCKQQDCIVISLMIPTMKLKIHSPVQLIDLQFILFILALLIFSSQVQRARVQDLPWSPSTLPMLGEFCEIPRQRRGFRTYGILNLLIGAVFKHRLQNHLTWGEPKSLILAPIQTSLAGNRTSYPRLKHPAWVGQESYGHRLEIVERAQPSNKKSAMATG